MASGKLSEYFEQVGVKRMSRVEVDAHTSHQHELAVPKFLRGILGKEKKTLICTFLYLDPEAEVPNSEKLELKYYNAREGKPRAAEYRMYYPDSKIIKLARAGDLLITAKKKQVDELLFIIIPNGHSLETHILQLFGLDDNQAQTETGTRIEIIGAADRKIEYAEAVILEELGIEVKESESERLDGILAHLNGRFPDTKSFSLLARNNVFAIDTRDDPDEALYQLMTFEEALFRRLERVVVSRRLHQGFFMAAEPDVDEFISYSLSVHNRRKSRAGQALENHLEHIFISNNIRYERGKFTENKQKPDFIFPGKAEYDDLSFPSENLVMLGAKSTVKERWGQILKEADRIKIKHLATMDTKIPESQIKEMKIKGIKLVLPKNIFSFFKSELASEFLSVSNFIQHLKSLK